MKFKIVERKTGITITPPIPIEKILRSEVKIILPPVFRNYMNDGFGKRVFK